MLCCNVYMFVCCFYIGTVRNVRFSLPGCNGIFLLKLLLLVQSEALNVTNDTVRVIWFL